MLVAPDGKPIHSNNGDIVGTLFQCICDTTAGLKTLAEVLDALLPGISDRNLKRELGEAIISARDQCLMNEQLMNQRKSEGESEDEPSSKA